MYSFKIAENKGNIAIEIKRSTELILYSVLYFILANSVI